MSFLLVGAACYSGCCLCEECYCAWCPKCSQLRGEFRISFVTVQKKNNCLWADLEDWNESPKSAKWCWIKPHTAWKKEGKKVYKIPVIDRGLRLMASTESLFLGSVQYLLAALFLLEFVISSWKKHTQASENTQIMHMSGFTMENQVEMKL